jgi:hypothetical protein
MKHIIYTSFRRHQVAFTYSAAVCITERKFVPTIPFNKEKDNEDRTVIQATPLYRMYSMPVRAAMVADTAFRRE